MEHNGHFTQAAIDKGAFPTHNGPDGSEYADGTLIQPDGTVVHPSDEPTPEEPSLEPIPLGPVRIETELDGDASRISCLLEALGYQVTRVGMTDEDARIKYAIDMIARRRHLSPREAEAVRLMAEGVSDAIGLALQLDVSPATAKWVQHCIGTKLGTGDIRSMIDRIAEAAS